MIQSAAKKPGSTQPHKLVSRIQLLLPFNRFITDFDDDDDYTVYTRV